MPSFTGPQDLSKEYTTYGARLITDYRPTAGQIYVAGNVLQIAPLDQQQYTDNMTVQLSVATSGATAANGLVAVVSDQWPGFNGSLGGGSLAAANQQTVAGTQYVTGVCKGIAGILIDQSGSNAVTVVNGTPLIASEATAGYAEGYTLKASPPSAGSSVIGVAFLPAAGIGDSLTAAALAQATRVFTVANPAAGDIVNTTIQSPYTTLAPGTIQKTTYSLTLTSAAAVSATTAGNAIVAFLNAQTGFSTYFTATNVAGAVTVTVNTAAAPFLVTYAANGVLSSQWNIPISGMVANSLTTAGSVTGAGGTTYSAAGTTFTGGTGFKGIIPAMIFGEY